MRQPSIFALRLMLALALATCTAASAAKLRNSPEPPVIPVGLDAYRMWDKWPVLRIGQRTYMRSTYDRRGGNEGADASHFLYQLADDRSVSLDVTGPGVLYFVRTNHWHGSPWHYIVDGRDNIVQESSTADPNHRVENSIFLPERQFPNPLTWTWSITKGADLNWVPMPFEKSFTMAYGRTRYGTGYYIFSKFAPGARNLSRPIKSWTMNDVPSKDVLKLINRSGEDIAPKDIAMRGGTISLKPGEAKTIVTLSNAPATIRALKFTNPGGSSLSEAHLRIYWDGSKTPSVDAPVALLFGTGTTYNRDERGELVKAFPVSVSEAPSLNYYSMYFPMPFMRSARIELVATQDSPITGLRWNVRYEPYTGPANWVGNFHATYVDHGLPTPGKDLVLLDTTKTEGGGNWCGSFVGTSFIFSDQAVLNTLEGDPRFFFDDSQTPQGQGTGTEEWGGGGDYWGGRNMTLPFAGHPVGCKSPKDARDEADKIESAYRFLLADLFPFGKNARIQLEHGGTNNSTEHYRTVTYWYGIHQACLVQTDALHVGDPVDEQKHCYSSPQASAVQTVTSRYELGVDHVGDQEIYPESTDTGRFTKGVSIFTLKLDPKNIGVMLRRKLDYSFPNQCAKVYISDNRPNAPWRDAGLWYTAGSNTCICSNPKGELGATEHNVQTSNRRWRDDEFLLPRSLTERRSSIRVKVVFVPKNIPLYPGQPLPEQAWSEFRYAAYCYVMPTL